MNLAAGLRWEMPILIPQTALISGRKSGEACAQGRLRAKYLMLRESSNP